MADDAKIMVRAKWPDEPGREYTWQAKPEAAIGRLFDMLWVDRCIRKGWGEIVDLPTEGSPSDTARYLRNSPQYYATRNDADGQVDEHTRLGEAQITRETVFLLRREDTGE